MRATAVFLLATVYSSGFYGGYDSDGDVRVRAFFNKNVFEGEDLKISIHKNSWDSELSSNLTVTIELCGAWPAPPPLMQETFTFIPNNEASIIETSFNIEHGFQAAQKESDYSRPCVKLALESEKENDDSEEYPDSYTEYYRRRNDRSITSTEYFNIKKRSRVLVQSDKAKYKPGNTVQFRIIAIDDELRAVNATIKYEVISPSQNVMAAVEKQNAKQVVHGSFQLDKFAEQGEWKFNVRSTTNDFGETVEDAYSFDVEEYVLPKYELNIIAESFVIEGEDFPFVVEAEYTFGQPVPGDAKIQVSEVDCSSRYYWNEPVAICGEFEECQERGLDKSVINSDGSVGDILTAAEWNGLFDENRPHYCDKQFEIKVTWEDTASGETIEAAKIINVEQEKYKIEVLYEPQVYKKKAGLNYIAQVKMIDGSTLDKEGQVEIAVKAKKWNNDKGEYDYETTRDSVALTFQDAGIFQYMIPEKHIEQLFQDKNSWYIDLEMSFEETSTSKSVRIPKSKFEMEIESDADGKLTPGTSIDLQIRADFTGEAVLFASSNGKIIAEYKIDAIENDEVVQSVEITSSMIPEVKFLVVSKAARENNDWAADSISFFVETNFDNEVLLSAPEKGELGQMIDIGIKSAENSRVYLLGVDKSVLLLKSGNDIDGKRVLEAKQGGPNEEHGWRPWPIWGGCGIWFPWGYGSSAQQKIEDAGFATMKLAIQEWSPRILGMARIIGGSGPYFDSPSYGYFDGPPGLPGKEPVTRKKFPETWIWSSLDTDEAGEASVNVEIPDTITSWIVTGFSLSAEKGLGYQKEPSKIVAFRDFFVKLELPYSIKQNEMFLLKAVVFNYLGQEIEADVTLELVPGMVLLADDVTKRVTIKAQNRSPVGWPIIIDASGVVSIKVKAVAVGNLAGDALERPLIVKPSGIPRTQAFNLLLRDEDSDEITVNFPPNVVPGSKRIEMRIFGDILSNTLQNIDSLLKMPYGCGEQNMINFAPAVFIYDYLEKKNELTEDIEEKATRIIQSGYQREMTYMHKGGGFSAFGENSYSKSSAATLLTAFVVKCFRAADKLSKKFIPDGVIEDQLDFLSSRFNMKTGNFEEQGKVFSSYIKGALDADGDIAITAYTLVPFLEGGIIPKYSALIDRALDNLEAEIPLSSNHHTLSLIAYNLFLAGRPSAEVAIAKLENFAKQEPGSTFWTTDSKYSGETPSVEISSYALMSYSRENEDFLPVFRGIMSQLSATGGFKSTQDTVIGLQAISQRALFFVSPDDNLEIGAMLDSDTDSFSWVPEPLTPANSNVVQIKNVELSGEGLFGISSTGKGTAMIQVIIHYNTEETSNEPFEVDFLFTDVAPKRKRKRRSADMPDSDFCIQVTTKATDNEDFRVPDGMSLVTIEHPSGFAHLSVEAVGDSDEPEKIEVNDDSTVLYYNDLAQAVAASVCLTKVQPVENPKPVYITVQDYYDPDAESSTEVQLRDLQKEFPLCDLCGDLCGDCKGAVVQPNPEPSPRPPSGPGTPPSGPGGAATLDGSPVLLQVVGGWTKAPVFIGLPEKIERLGLKNNWNRDKLANYVLKLREHILLEDPKIRQPNLVYKCRDHLKVFKSILDKILA